MAVPNIQPPPNWQPIGWSPNGFNSAGANVPIISTSRRVTNAELLTMNSVNIQIVPALGANLICVPVTVATFVHQENNYSASRSINLAYQAAGFGAGNRAWYAGQVALQDVVANPTNAVVERYEFLFNQIGEQSIAPLFLKTLIANTPIVAQIDTADVAGGDANSYAVIQVSYIVLDVS
jgi:hypothetical protein